MVEKIDRVERVEAIDQLDRIIKFIRVQPDENVSQLNALWTTDPVDAKPPNLR